MLIKLVKTALEMKDIYITANDNNDAEKENESQDSSTSSQTMQLRRSMFGVKSLLYKSSKRNSLEDFDDIRSILSHSKVEDNWESHVDENGEVFYVDVTNETHRSQRRTRHKPANTRTRYRRRRLRDNHCPCHCQQQNDRKSEIPENQNCNMNGVNVLQSFDSHFVNTNYLESLIDFQSQLLANDEEDKNGNILDEKDNVIENSKDFKEIHLLPDEHAVCPGLSGDFVSKTLHFHAFFGAILCRYSQCAQPKTGVSQGMLEETKLVVQYVEPGSPAGMAGVMKGDVLLRLDDTEASLLLEKNSLCSLPNQTVYIVFRSSGL
ncbi:uncharacterized protein LOC125681983 isoform X3 [Ostrea edulis]|uniref:uncharacterized protein LOC125681983 isoform X3 n=2 Tax=Ostrea edulis TaxID=37623 RepID=UPI0024AFE00B|nr:uncharacterized protein LOC125681983 isoform X3 [Ostrea edulis]